MEQGKRVIRYYRFCRGFDVASLSDFNFIEMEKVRMKIVEIGEVRLERWEREHRNGNSESGELLHKRLAPSFGRELNYAP